MRAGFKGLKASETADKVIVQARNVAGASGGLFSNLRGLKASAPSGLQGLKPLKICLVIDSADKSVPIKTAATIELLS